MEKSLFTEGPGIPFVFAFGRGGDDAASVGLHRRCGGLRLCAGDWGVPGLLALLVAAGPAEVYGVFAATGMGAGEVAGVGVGSVALAAGAGAAGALEDALAGAGVVAGATGAGDAWPTVGLEAFGLLSFVLPGVFGILAGTLVG